MEKKEKNKLVVTAIAGGGVAGLVGGLVGGAIVNHGEKYELSNVIKDSSEIYPVYAVSSPPMEVISPTPAIKDSLGIYPEYGVISPETEFISPTPSIVPSLFPPSQLAGPDYPVDMYGVFAPASFDDIWDRLEFDIINKEIVISDNDLFFEIMNDKDKSEEMYSELYERHNEVVYNQGQVFDIQKELNAYLYMYKNTNN